MTYRFNGFTEKANNAMNLAISSAEELGHDYVGSEHSVKEIIRAGPKKGAQNQPRPPRSFQGTSEKEEKFKQNQVQ